MCVLCTQKNHCDFQCVFEVAKQLSYVIKTVPSSLSYGAKTFPVTLKKTFNNDPFSYCLDTNAINLCH